LPDSSKYDIFMNELLSLEKLIGVFAQKGDDEKEANTELRQTITRLEQENQALKNKIKEIEKQISQSSNEDEGLFGNNSISSEDREEVKSKISDLISKLDNHLRS
jgi:predicted  nucleic acid-binding Zn-ribbon protein